MEPRDARLAKTAMAMLDRPVKIGVIANPRKNGAKPTLARLRAACETRGIQLCLEKETAELMEEAGGIEAAELGGQVDLIAVLGGDGTMLNAVSRLGETETPVAGINIGTLGFLTTCKDTELDEFAACIAAGKFITSDRSMLDVRIVGPGRKHEERGFLALNEVTLARGQTGRLVSVAAFINGELLNHYRADGLIVATPTGSTAYSLSAGGPLISPEADVFVVTPICPHTLSQRSLVLSDDAVIEIAPQQSEDLPMLFTVDGRDCVSLGDGETLSIRKAKASFHLVRLEGHSFYNALREKLRWSGGS